MPQLRKSEFTVQTNKQAKPKNQMLLFPHKTRFLGLILIFLSLPFGYFYFWGGKPDIFNIKVFAVVSAYIETRYLVVAQTNMLDELSAILLITGTGLFSFAREKKEENYYNDLRTKALIRSVYYTLGLWMLSFMLVFGVAIFIVSSCMFIFFLIIYNILFRYYIFRTKKLTGK